MGTARPQARIERIENRPLAVRVRADERSVRKSFSTLRRHPVHRLRCGIIRAVPVLLIAGIARVVFGAFVLLKFPDRPGGEIAWQGMTVKSVGGGLPLIVLGVAAIAIASFREPGGPTGSGDPIEIRTRRRRGRRRVRLSPAWIGPSWVSRRTGADSAWWPLLRAALWWRRRDQTELYPGKPVGHTGAASVASSAACVSRVRAMYCSVVCTIALDGVAARASSSQRVASAPRPRPALTSQSDASIQ